MGPRGRLRRCSVQNTPLRCTAPSKHPASSDTPRPQAPSTSFVPTRHPSKRYQHTGPPSPGRWEGRACLRGRWVTTEGAAPHGEALRAVQWPQAREGRGPAVGGPRVCGRRNWAECSRAAGRPSGSPTPPGPALLRVDRKRADMVPGTPDTGSHGHRGLHPGQGFDSNPIAETRTNPPGLSGFLTPSCCMSIAVPTEFSGTVMQQGMGTNTL